MKQKEVPFKETEAFKMRYPTCSVDNIHPNWTNQELHPSMRLEE